MGHRMKLVGVVVRVLVGTVEALCQFAGLWLALAAIMAIVTAWLARSGLRIPVKSRSYPSVKKATSSCEERN